MPFIQRYVATPPARVGGTQAVTGDLELSVASTVVLDPSVYTQRGTYTLFTWTGSFLYPGGYSTAQDALDALLTLNASGTGFNISPSTTHGKIDTVAKTIIVILT